METTEMPVLSGYLNVPTQSGFSINRISKKKSCQRYCLLFKASCHGVKRLEIGESKDDKNPKIITLENCVKITQQPSPANLIQIVKQTGTLTLNTLTDEDLKEWINALQTVAFRDKSSSHAAIEEDNDLYCRSYGDGLFIVTLIPSDASIRSSIEPKTYMLHLTATELQLKLAEDINVEIAKWPYRFIRKYGYRDGKFTFEAGRKCSTGEGVFTLDHTSPQEIFRCMSAKMKTMKKLISGDSLSSIECGEIQLSVAASMEAGSRSPLPPSPSNQNNNEFEINSTQSCISLRGFISSSDSLNNCPVNSSPNSVGGSVQPTKHIPSKPPRKLPLVSEKPLPPVAVAHSIKPLNVESKTSGQSNCDKYKKFPNYELVSITSSIDPNKTAGSSVLLKPKSSEDFRNSEHPPDLPVRNESTKAAQNERDYECIEAITEAWKTLGVGDIKHTERYPDPSENSHDFIRQRTLAQREKSTIKESLLTSKTPTIIDIDIGEGSGGAQNPLQIDSTYDRLDFLSPNNNTSSCYKTVVKVTQANPNSYFNIPSTANDYELIASPEIQSCRKADDSHLGYGMLRKSSTNLEKSKSNNNTNYSRSTSSVQYQPVSDKAATQDNPNPSEVKTLDHHNYNGLEYTIVSRPKRV